jgi:hypothetical protein
MSLVARSSGSAMPTVASLPEALRPARAATAAAAAPAVETGPALAAGEPPPSTVREEYRHSGQWREDAPAALTGR